MIALGISAFALFVFFIVLVSSSAKEFRVRIPPQFNSRTLKKTSRTNILHIIYSFEIGGAEKIEADILGNIDTERFNVSVISYDSETKYDYELGVARARGVRIILKAARPDAEALLSKNIFCKIYRAVLRLGKRIRPAMIEILTYKLIAPDVIHLGGMNGHLKIRLRIRGDDMWIKDNVDLYVRFIRRIATSFDTLAWKEDGY